jgi:hypothetical protein
MTPRKRVQALASLAGVIAVSSALASVHPRAANAYAARSASATAGTTIKLLEDENGSTFVRIGRHTGTAAGDEGLLSRTLRTMQKKPVGELNISCVVTRGGLHSISICTGVYELPGGTLVGTTIGRGQSTYHIATTGGTGRYEGARGSLSVSGKTGFATDMIHLLP